MWHHLYKNIHKSKIKANAMNYKTINTIQLIQTIRNEIPHAARACFTCVPLNTRFILINNLRQTIYRVTNTIFAFLKFRRNVSQLAGRDPNIWLRLPDSVSVPTQTRAAAVPVFFTVKLSIQAWRRSYQRTEGLILYNPPPSPGILLCTGVTTGITKQKSISHEHSGVKYTEEFTGKVRE